MYNYCRIMEYLIRLSLVVLRALYLQCSKCHGHQIKTKIYLFKRALKKFLNRYNTHYNTFVNNKTKKNCLCETWLGI